jgi:plastocyanin
MRANRIATFGTAITLILAACSGGASPTPLGTTAPGASSGGAGGSSAVEIKNIAFNPAAITVKPGDKVTWTNNDSVTHTVTLDDNSVDSGDLAAGSTFDHAFASAGTFAYHCKIHSSMHGTITVTP